MSHVKTSTYTYRDFPWLSKSKVLGYRFCQHLFKLRYIDGFDTGTTQKMETGTNMHVVYARFFDYLDYSRLSDLAIDYMKPIRQTNVYSYIHNVLMSMLPQDARNFEPYQVMIRNFAYIETEHWIYLNKKFQETYSKVIKFFKPKLLEKYFECESLQIFGTVDRVDVWEENEEVSILYDYKTGNIPIAIRQERDVDPADAFSWKLPTKMSFQLHFYMVLDMVRRGYKINEKIVDYCTNPDNFVIDKEIPKVDSFFFAKNGEPINYNKLYRIGIIYTGDENRPFVAKKKVHWKSLKSVFRWINRIRTVLKNNGPYNKEPDYWKCKECNDTVKDDCLTEQEHDMIFWKSDQDE